MFSPPKKTYVDVSMRLLLHILRACPKCWSSVLTWSLSSLSDTLFFFQSFLEKVFKNDWLFCCCSRYVIYVVVVFDGRLGRPSLSWCMYWCRLTYIQIWAASLRWFMFWSMVLILCSFILDVSVLKSKISSAIPSHSLVEWKVLYYKYLALQT